MRHRAVSFSTIMRRYEVAKLMPICDALQCPSSGRSDCLYLLIVLLQPLQLLAHLDVAVPGILVKAVSFARKDEECVRNAQ